jgi:hypothetical protein
VISDLLKELDKVSMQALKECAQPISRMVQYEAGRRIGVSQGIARARQQLIDFYSKDSAKDRDL